VLASEIKSSPKERAKTNHKQMKSDDTVICFTEVRFLQTYSSFPLSNGHLDRVSFLLNQMGHLDPTRTTTHLVSLALITSHLRIRMGIEESTIAKAKQQERQISHGSLSLSSR
jgi:hypothetical protein